MKTENYIARLKRERDEAIAQLHAVNVELIELQTYLSGQKFAWPDHDYVHVRTDMLPRLAEIRRMSMI